MRPRAPSTALRAVPLPRFAGADEGESAATNMPLGSQALPHIRPRTSVRGRGTARVRGGGGC